MSKRGENIRKRKDGRWEGRYKAGVYPGGGIRYRSVYGKTYAEVKEKLYRAVADIQTGVSVASAQSAQKTFFHILNLWLESNRVRIKDSTAYKYTYLIEKHIAPDLGALRLSDITAQRINSYLEQKLQNGRLDRTGGLSPSYVKTIMLIIQSALRFAVAEEYCAPLKNKINKPQEQKEELSVLSIEDQRKLEAYLQYDTTGTGLGILLCLYTGLRIGEVCALSWQDVDLERQIIHVRHTVVRIKSDARSQGKKSQLAIDVPKTKSSKRDIPISSLLLPRLRERQAHTVSRFVVSDTPDFISPRTYEYRYHRILKQCGIAKIHFHALRHTFATRCVEAGVDIKSLSEILGHANVAITLNEYVHSSMQQKKTQLEKLVSYSA